MVAPAKIIERMQRADKSYFVFLLRSAIALLMGGATMTLSAAGWPVFRGNPGLTGVAEGALPSKPALLWTFKTGGPVKSSAVIGGGTSKAAPHGYAVHFRCAVGHGKPWKGKRERDCGEVTGSCWRVHSGSGPSFPQTMRAKRVT